MSCIKTGASGLALLLHLEAVVLTSTSRGQHMVVVETSFAVLPVCVFL